MPNANLEEQILTQLNALAAQGQQTAQTIALMQSKLFGSVEDAFEAGRLPQLERQMRDHEAQLREIQRRGGFVSGELSVAGTLGKWFGRLAIATLGAAVDWVFRHK